MEPKEKPLTQAEIERMEREALRKEQEEEFEATLMEDKIKEAERQAKQDKIDAARREKEEAENAKNSVMSGYTQHIESAKERLAASAQESAEGVLLRLRCPDGLQLTRKFAKDSPVSDLYDFVDVERYNKAAKVSPRVHAALGGGGCSVILSSREAARGEQARGCWCWRVRQARGGNYISGADRALYARFPWAQQTCLRCCCDVNVTCAMRRRPMPTMCCWRSPTSSTTSSGCAALTLDHLLTVCRPVLPSSLFPAVSPPLLFCPLFDYSRAQHYAEAGSLRQECDA
jgi:hypothetical protein